MTGRVDQIQLIAFAVFGLVLKPDGLRLDRDAAFPLQVHAVEDLRLHFPGGQSAGQLDQAVGQRRLAMIDMRNDAEITDVGGVHQEGRRQETAAAGFKLSAILRGVNFGAASRRMVTPARSRP